MPSGMMGLTQDGYWHEPGLGRSDVVAAFSRTPWKGYALDAPSEVDVEVRDTLPLVGLRRVSAVDSVRHQYRDNAVLVAVVLESGRVYAGRAFPFKAPTPPPKSKPSPTITLTEAFDIELRTQLPTLPWAPSTLLLSLVVLEEASEPVVVRLVGGRQTYESVPLWNEPWPKPAEAGLPRYVPGPATPAVPSGVGLSMVAERVVLLRDESWCVVEGAFRVPNRQRAEGDTFVALTFLLVGATLDLPWSVEIIVPATAHDDGTVSGTFALNLLTFEDFPRRAGTHYLWAFVGDAQAGPEAIGMVSPARLAPA